MGENSGQLANPAPNKKFGGGQKIKKKGLVTATQPPPSDSLEKSNMSLEN